jgi:hypothetical protein
MFANTQETMMAKVGYVRVSTTEKHLDRQRMHWVP